MECHAETRAKQAVTRLDQRQQLRPMGIRYWIDVIQSDHTFLNGLFFSVGAMTVRY